MYINLSLIHVVVYTLSKYKNVGICVTIECRICLSYNVRSMQTALDQVRAHNQNIRRK